MIYDLSNPFESAKFREKVTDVLSGGGMVRLESVKPPRSLSQNAYLHVLLGFFGSEFGLPLAEVKQDIFKRLVNPQIFLKQHINKRGQSVSYLRSTKDLDTAEMTSAIERFRNYSASELEFYLPSPNEEGALRYAQKQIESNKTFL